MIRFITLTLFGAASCAVRRCRVSKITLSKTYRFMDVELSDVVRCRGPVRRRVRSPLTSDRRSSRSFKLDRRLTNWAVIVSEALMWHVLVGGCRYDASAELDVAFDPCMFSSNVIILPMVDLTRTQFRTFPHHHTAPVNQWRRATSQPSPESQTIASFCHLSDKRPLQVTGDRV